MVRLTQVSGNRKTGPIPVSTSDVSTCPDSCPFKDNGCYASHGPLRLIWASVAEKGIPWDTFCKAIARLPRNQLWRHNQAGDLPGDNGTIDADQMVELVEANRHKAGFTYTHKPLTDHNLLIIRDAIDKGFAVNVSCDNLQHFDEVHAEHPDLPKVCVLPHGFAGKHMTTPDGHRITVCPATYRDDVTCATCRLCQRIDRKHAIGFPAHGPGYKRVEAVAVSQGVLL